MPCKSSSVIVRRSGGIPCIKGCVHFVPYRIVSRWVWAERAARYLSRRILSELVPAPWASNTCLSCITFPHVAINHPASANGGMSGNMGHWDRGNLALNLLERVHRPQVLIGLEQLSRIRLVFDALQGGLQQLSACFRRFTSGFHRGGTGDTILHP